MTEIVSTISDLAFLLSDNPEMIRQLPPQRVLHALLPDTATRNRTLPQGSSFADVWMLKNGNPLSSVDAALKLVHVVNPKYYLHMDLYEKGLMRAGLYLGSGDIAVSEGASETLPGAIVIALLEHVSMTNEGTIA